MTTLNKTLNAADSISKQHDVYWAEKVKMQVALDLESQRKLVDLSCKELAVRVGVSPAYISKVLRGDSNLTIETMVKLARSVGGELEVRILDARELAACSDVIKRFSLLNSTSLGSDSLPIGEVINISPREAFPQVMWRAQSPLQFQAAVASANTVDGNQRKELVA